MPKNILVTGAAGFIGSRFVKWVLEQETESHLTSLDLLTYAGNLENLSTVLSHPRHSFVKGSICDTSLVSRLVADVDLIVNFAAESHVDRSINGPVGFLETNVGGTMSLLESVRLCGRKIRFLQVSTDEVYGSLGVDGSFTEQSPLRPNNPYAATKASADLMVRSYVETYGVDAVITRCTNNYGPNQFPEKLIPLMVKNAKFGRKLPVYGDGLNVRDWVHVDDHVSGIWLAARQGRCGEIYNFGSQNEWKNIDIVKQVLKIMVGLSPSLDYLKPRSLIVLS